MKIEEVPQDSGFLIEGKVRDVCYAIDENGHYRPVLSKGWKPKNLAMQMAWDQVYENARQIREEVLSGRLSPLAFYMEISLMTPLILSEYTGIPRRRIRKHLKMKHFKKIDPKELARYAGAMNLTPVVLTDQTRIRDFVFSDEPAPFAE